MKFYLKQYKDFYPINFHERYLVKLGTEGTSVDVLAEQFRIFYHDWFAQLWYFYVCQIWFEGRLVFDGVKRERKGSNYLPVNNIHAAFFNLVVGISPSLIINTRLWPVMISYFFDFYPDHEKHNPLLDPDYYIFPYDHVTLDFLPFVYQVENRRELLEEAEKQKMPIAVFQNFVVNWVLSYNDEVGEEIYVLRRHPDNTWYIKNMKKVSKKGTFQP